MIVNNSTQNELVDIGPVMDQSKSGERINSEKLEQLKY